ncbi:MAG: 5'/3'-nucleotidase SurE [Clostridia bacterium]|nr:5'/3'-nucleotidase SurE [Clostridia bacterium]
MRILITNDDGIHANGIQALRKAFSQLGEVTVVAPDREKSATGHCITVHDPIRVEELCFIDQPCKAWAVDGTPSDCVKIAVQKLMEHPPDLIVSGINRGANLGTDVLYSGTVSAAIEGAIEGFPSLAVSLTSFDYQDYSYAAEFAAKVGRFMVEEALPPGTLLNVNVPALPKEEIQGVSISKLGNRRYKNIFQKRTDPRGKIYYWMAGEVYDLDEDDPVTDVAAIKRKEISITPIHFDLTNYNLMDQVKDFGIKK